MPKPCDICFFFYLLTCEHPYPKTHTHRLTSAAGRPRPIPFYGELGSVNPVFVTQRAASEEGDRIWRELASSFTLGAGQFCTKPGIVFAPRDADAPAAVASHLAEGASWPLLDSRIASGFADRIEEMTARADEMAARADEMTARADEMTARADEMTARADEMASR